MGVLRRMDENIQNSNVNNTQKPSGTAAIIME